MGRLVKVVILTILISSLGMINLPSATADGIVDQSNVPGTAALVAPIPTTPPLNIQTFTPIVPDIVAVDLFLSGGDSTTLLDIFVTDNAGAAVISQGGFNPGCPCTITTPVHIDLTGQVNPLSVSLENTLSVQLSAGSSANWLGSGANAYAPGSAQGPGTDPSIHDFFFRTYFLAGAGVGMSMNIVPGCILTVNTVATAFGVVSPPAPGVATFNFQNDGTATQVVSADVGNDVNGGMQDSVPEVTILPQDMTVDASTAFDTTPTATMLDTGAIVKIADLQPITSGDENNIARVGTITAATDNLQNLPASGTLIGTLTLTGGACT